MIRAYVFIQRNRGIHFFELDSYIRELRKSENNPGIVASQALWGQHDILLVIERKTIDLIYKAVASIHQTDGDSMGNPATILNSSTMVAAKIDGESFQSFSSGTDNFTVLAINTNTGHEQEVRDALRRKKKEVLVADIVLGDYDVIALVRLDRTGGYDFFMKDVAKAQIGIQKTVTMFGFTPPS